MQLKRLFYFLLINIIVSAVTTLIVLTLWERSMQTETAVSNMPSATGLMLAATPTVVVPMESSYTATPELRAYQVSNGETLGEIAFSYGITVEELLALNGLTNPDSIGAGATIFVPVDVQSGSAAGEVDGGSGGSEDFEVVVNPEGGEQVDIAAVIGAGDLGSERVQLRGLGDGTLSLTDWQLRDEDGNVYTFPQITLFGSGAVEIYSTTGVDTVVALYWNSGEAIWESGEAVTLLDDSGVLQATYNVP